MHTYFAATCPFAKNLKKFKKNKNPEFNSITTILPLF
jgi:hypothetical protein